MMSLYHLIEITTVSALVLGCAVYCTLRLAPNMVMRRLRTALMGLPLPVAVTRRMASGRGAGGCGVGCSGCAAAAPDGSNQPPR